jgi:hypothetical protein
MRVAANQFFVEFGDNIGDGEAALLASDLSVKEDLEKEVTEFLGELGIVCAIEGIEDFVGFFDEISAEGGVGLLAVPGAAVGRAEARHDSDEFFKGGADAGSTARLRPAGRPARGFRLARRGSGAF